MIIKNNFNERSASPLKNYDKIGKGSHSLDRELDKERKGFIRENMENPVMQDLRGENQEIENDRKENDWDFFR